MGRLSQMRAAHDGVGPVPVAPYDALELQQLLATPEVRTTARITLAAGGKAYEVIGARVAQGGCIVLLDVEKIG